MTFTLDPRVLDVMTYLNGSGQERCANTSLISHEAPEVETDDYYSQMFEDLDNIQQAETDREPVFVLVGGSDDFEAWARLLPKRQRMKARLDPWKSGGASGRGVRRVKRHFVTNVRPPHKCW